MKIILSILSLGLFLTCAQAQEVTVATDKLEYTYADKIKIILENGLEQSIFSHIASATPAFCIKNIERKLASGEWEQSFAYAQSPYVTYDIDAPAEINPGDYREFTAEPYIYINGTQQKIEIGPGTYRFAILYQIRNGPVSQNWAWTVVRSNEFVVKE